MSGAGWTNQQLIEEARKRGFTLDERRISFFTTTGLLDKIERNPAGRGSNPGVRSDNQAELLWVVLQQNRTARKPATLANIPVFVWLGWGESYVPIRQVRRCLRTYAAAYNVASQAACRRTTDELIESLGFPHVTTAARNALADVISQINVEARPNLEAHRDNFRQALRDIAGNAAARPRLDAMVDFVDLRVRALHHFDDGTDEGIFPDAAFYRAQLNWQQTRFDYVQQSQRPISDINEDMATSACLSLLAHLGHDLRATQGRQQ